MTVNFRISANPCVICFRYAETSDTGSDSRSSDTKESEQVLKSRGKEMLETSNDMCTDVGINVSVHSGNKIKCIFFKFKYYGSYLYINVNLNNYVLKL